MTAWIYRKLEPSDVRGLCLLCNKRPQKKRNNGTYRALCSGCDNKRFNIKVNLPYRKFKLKYCERCNFIPEHKCQLDVDHIDGNHHNNDPNNLQTLCANCHRLKSYRQRYAPAFDRGFFCALFVM